MEFRIFPGRYLARISRIPSYPVNENTEKSKTQSCHNGSNNAGNVKKDDFNTSRHFF